MGSELTSYADFLAAKRKCIALGWVEDASASFDRCDAMAVWAKAASDIDPSINWQSAPLAQPLSMGA